MNAYVFERVDGIFAGRIVIHRPIWTKLTELPSEAAAGKALIRDFRLWAIGETAKCPSLIGKRFPVHDDNPDPYAWDLYFRQVRPDKVAREIRDQFDEMTAILADRPSVAVDYSRLPKRTPPHSTRRNAWAIDGRAVVDRREIVTLQEVVMASSWAGERLSMISGKGLIAPMVAEWRKSPSCWSDSRFTQPVSATFDERLLSEADA